MAADLAQHLSRTIASLESGSNSTPNAGACVEMHFRDWESAFVREEVKLKGQRQETEREGGQGKWNTRSRELLRHHFISSSFIRRAHPFASSRPVTALHQGSAPAFMRVLSPKAPVSIPLPIGIPLKLEQRLSPSRAVVKIAIRTDRIVFLDDGHHSSPLSQNARKVADIARVIEWFARRRSARSHDHCYWLHCDLISLGIRDLFCSEYCWIQRCSRSFVERRVAGDQVRDVLLEIMARLALVSFPSQTLPKMTLRTAVSTFPDSI